LLEKWEAKGIAKGRAEEKVATSRNMVLRFLRAKFNKIPKGIEKAILAMSDPIALESLAEHAAHSVTLDEFATALR